MKLNTHIKSIQAEIRKNRLVLWSKAPLNVLSSATLNGGLRDTNGIMNVHVPEDCSDDEIHRNAEDFLRKEAAELDLPSERVVGLMTAADVRKVSVISRRLADITLSVFVTAGTSFSATAGDEIASKKKPLQSKNLGTINIIALIDGNLTDSCMVGAANTVTEAKTVALRELDIRSRVSGDLASGTVTDSVVVACTKQGKPIKYAGTATALGELLGESVKESVKNAIQKQENMLPDRSLTKRLEERGISITKMTTLFSQTHPTIKENARKLTQFQKELQQVLRDQNVVSLVIALLRLDDDAKLGLIPESPTDAASNEKLVDGGILQNAIVDYLSKKDDKSTHAHTKLGNSAITHQTSRVTEAILYSIMNCVYSSLFSDNIKHVSDSQRSN